MNEIYKKKKGNETYRYCKNNRVTVHLHYKKLTLFPLASNLFTHALSRIMSDKKITPHQMRKGLTYVSQGPDFMRMLTGQSSNAANNDPRNPYKKPIGIEAKFQTEESDDDDDTAHDILNEREEERPTVVVLKDGKHLDERQVRNVLKNLPPGT